MEFRIEDIKDTQLMINEIILKEIIKDELEDLRIGIKKINGEIKKIKKNFKSVLNGWMLIKLKIIVFDLLNFQLFK